MKKNIQPIQDPESRKASIHRFSKTITNKDIDELTQKNYSKSTILAMASDWNHFVEFCELRHVSPLPASLTAIRLFLETEAQKRKYATLRRYSITIGIIHQLHLLSDPTAHRQTRFVLKTLRMMKHGDARQATAFSQHHLQQLDSIMSKELTSKSLRDLAIYYVMFECALKRSELRDLQIDSLNLSGDSVTILIKDASYQLSKTASNVIRKWLSFVPEQTGCLFRRIDRHGNIGSESLNDSSIYRILRQASDILGLSVDMRFTGQSARVGAVKELEKQGYNLKSIQEFGRWLSPAMPAQYLDKTDIAELEKAKFRIIKPWE